MRSISQHAADIPAEFERGRREYEEQLRVLEEQRRKRRESQGERVGITEVVDRVLRRKDWSAADRMRQLSLVCLSRDLQRYSNLDGDWPDLDATRQAEVLHACCEGLVEGTPTPIPGHREFTTLNYAEGRAFMMIVADPAYEAWLDESLIARWLPVVLRTNHSRSVATITACGKANHGATVAVLISAVEEELRASEQQGMMAGVIPADLWSGEITSRAVGFIQDDSLDLGSRVGLLESLARREPAAATSIATRFLSIDARPGLSDPLRRRVLDVLLRVDAESALPLVEEEFCVHGREGLRSFTSLGYQSDQLKADIVKWPTPRLIRLGEILLRGYPLSESKGETPGRAYRVTADHELRHTRDRIVDVLLDRQVDENEALMMPLVELEPSLADRGDWVRRQREASRLLGSVSAARKMGNPNGLHVISPDHVVRLLDRAMYRLIRTDEDLLAALLTILDRIKEDVAYDLAMLYGKPDSEGESSPPKSQSNKKPIGKRVRRRLDEDALQAYIRRRLCDLSPSYVPDVLVEVIREPQVKYQRRFDLLITAPTVERDQATVIIEIKWSDNKEVRTGLVEQLARKYLRDHHLSRGIYLVGWMGHWKSAEGSSDDLAALELLLRGQSAEITADSQLQAAAIEPIILDLRWRDDL